MQSNSTKSVADVWPEERIKNAITTTCGEYVLSRHQALVPELLKVFTVELKKRQNIKLEKLSANLCLAEWTHEDKSYERGLNDRLKWVLDDIRRLAIRS